MKRSAKSIVQYPAENCNHNAAYFFISIAGEREGGTDCACEIIQKAYRDLEAEGYIYSVRAKGSFVAPQKEVVKKSDTDEVMAEFKALVSKMKFLGITYGDVRSAVDEEFTEGEDNK